MSHDPGDVPDYLDRNRGTWARLAAEFAEPGRRNWASEPQWGNWNIPEAELRLLPDVSGRDTLELGCGTGYVSAWLARLGARPVGLDLTPEQLHTARRLQREFSLEYPLVRAAAELTPFRDKSFDLVISEYGAAIWCDPYRWIPEAARLLRPGGELIFLGNATLLMLCMPDEENAPAGTVLVRDHFGLHRMEWSDGPEVEFHMGHGDRIRLLRANGFVIEDLIELRPSADATTRDRYVPHEWARRWPCEEVWKARKL